MIKCTYDFISFYKSLRNRCQTVELVIKLFSLPFHLEHLLWKIAEKTFSLFALRRCCWKRNKICIFCFMCCGDKNKCLFCHFRVWLAEVTWMARMCQVV